MHNINIKLYLKYNFGLTELEPIVLNHFKIKFKVLLILNCINI